MRVSALDGLVAPMFEGLKDLPVCLVVASVGDHLHGLFAEEFAVIQDSVPRRQREFASGRRAAHEALSLMGAKPSAVGSAGRKPLWPSGLVGSIAHSRSLVAAVVCEASELAGIGVDVVSRKSVSQKVEQRISLPAEQGSLSAFDHEDRGSVIFCMKEAIYKAVNPVTDEYLGFKDVCVVHDSVSGTFTAKCVQDRTSSDIVSRGLGATSTFEDHWISLFACSSRDSEEIRCQQAAGFTEND